MTRRVTRTSDDALDPGIFATWMAMIGDRIGRRLDDDTLGAYYAELAQRLDTPAFVRGARAIFGRPLFSQWPGWEEFVDASSPTADVLTPPGPEATLARIDAERAAPRPSAAALDAFGAAWRQVVPPPEEKPVRPPRARRGARLLSAPALDLSATLTAVLDRVGAPAESGNSHPTPAAP